MNETQPSTVNTVTTKTESPSKSRNVSHTQHKKVNKINIQKHLGHAFNAVASGLQCY